MSPALYETQALGTGAQLLVVEPSVLRPAVDLLHRELERIDLLASRFRPDSELSRVNRAANGPVAVSADFLALVDTARWAAAATDGAVDPTIGPALVRLGYDRDFGELPAVRDGTLPALQPACGWREIVVDHDHATVSMPHHTVLDLGATAKALTADRAATTIAERCDTGVLVSLGGDIAVAGRPPDGGFAIGLADVWNAPESAVSTTISITSGGVATSGTAARHWWLGTQHVHHVIDPRTGRPSRGPWQTVTVAAASCLHANVASTAAMVKGRPALAWLEAQALPARLVCADGRVLTTAAWPAEASAEASGVGAAGAEVHLPC